MSGLPRGRAARFSAVAAGFIICWAAAYGMRTLHYEREASRMGEFVPFTIESAMMYSYSLDVAQGRGIPVRDGRLAGAEDVDVARQMSLGLEYFLGYGYRLKTWLFPPPPGVSAPNAWEENPDFSRWARIQIRLWTSLTAGMVFLWALVARCPWILALAGGLLMAVSPAAIARHTGQDLIRPEFAFPFIAAAFLLALWARRGGGWLRAFLAGAAVFMAMAFWDACQIVFAVWALAELFRLCLARRPGRRAFRVWAAVAAGVVMTGILVSYYREHVLLASPLVVVLLPSVLLGCAMWKSTRRRRTLSVCAALASLLAVWAAAKGLTSYGSNYGHFAELVKAKIVHLNVKPKDPRDLSFDARILWTPGMHSVTDFGARSAAVMTISYFPVMAWLLLGLLGAALFRSRLSRSVRRGLAWSFIPLCMFGFYAATFPAIVRHHDLCALFMAAAMPMVARDAWRAWRGSWSGSVLAVAMALLLSAEAFFSAFMLVRAYLDPYYKVDMELVKTLRAANVDGRTMLANFTVSPLLKAYCGARIVLHPKFELKDARDKVKEFLESLYDGGVESCGPARPVTPGAPDLAKFCVRNGVDYFLYDRGFFESPSIYGMRYCAGAVKVRPDSACAKMHEELARRQLRWFQKLDLPSDVEAKYTLFKVITPDDAAAALKLSKEVRVLLKSSATAKERTDNRSIAFHLAKQAVSLDPNSPEAVGLYLDLFGQLPEFGVEGLRRSKLEKAMPNLIKLPQSMSIPKQGGDFPDKTRPDLGKAPLTP